MVDSGLSEQPERRIIRAIYKQQVLRKSSIVNDYLFRRREIMLFGYIIIQVPDEKSINILVLPLLTSQQSHLKRLGSITSVGTTEQKALPNFQKFSKAACLIVFAATTLLRRLPGRSLSKRTLRHRVLLIPDARLAI